jgi:Rps23 Pro-64 3,4-dihydroxylase Tpa1-like proline 4-hydroxylase
MIFDNNPFPHLICEDFVRSDLIHNIKNEYDDTLKNKIDEWNKYDNPIEHKLSFNKFEDTLYLKQLFDIVGDEKFIKSLQHTFDIEDIELDTDLYGAGLHNYPKGGYLCTHLDYEVNPITFKKRWLK